MPIFKLLKSWRFWIRLLILLFYLILIVVILPLLVTRAIKDGFQRKTSIPLIGGVFVIMTLPMSFWLIIQHMLYYSKPKLQKHIIRILWMVPIYSLNAWFSLLYPDNVMYLNSFRECYEAYVIYSFMRFLFNYLHECFDDIVETLENKPQVSHIFPLCFLSDWKMGRDLIHGCKHGILQYTVVRPLMTVIAVLCHWSDDETNKQLGFISTFIVNNISQFVAMYCLVLFYCATKEELAPMKPVGKFLCIKAVIFFSFFQSVIITILVWTGILQPFLNFTQMKNDRGGDIAEYIQNFLLCIEMFLAAIGHHYSFTVDTYAEILCSRKSWKEALYALWDFSDVGADIKEHLGVVGTSITRHIKPRSNTSVNNLLDDGNKSESSPLLVDNFKLGDNIHVVHRDAQSSSKTKIVTANIC